MNELLFEPMHAVARRIEDRDLSAVEVTEASLQQVEAYNDRLNAFVTLTSELAMDMARERDAELANGVYRGPLHGVPVVLKDLFDTAGIPTCGGSKTLLERIPERDATIVARLREAGAVFLGKTGMPEFANVPTSTNPTFGPVHNPWNLQYDTAGSSSGTAAAIAAGIGWCGPGTDTGGSVRMPSAACGLAGLKPTYGRISQRGVMPLSATFDHVGPMARTVRDSALLLAVLAGYDPEDPYSRDTPVDDYTADLEQGIAGRRIAVIADDGRNEIEPDILESFRAGVRTLEDAGAVVEEVDFSFIGAWLMASRPLVSADLFAHHGHLLAEHPDDLSSYVTRSFERGSSLTGAEVMEIRRGLDAGTHQIERMLRQYDLAVSPTLAVHPPACGEERGDLVRFTMPWNLAGWPAATVPVGLSPDNIPIGFQVIGRPWTEAMILRAARVVERDHSLSYPPAGLTD